jgi:hypothetical protein
MLDTVGVSLITETGGESFTELKHHQWTAEKALMH